MNYSWEQKIKRKIRLVEEIGFGNTDLYIKDKNTEEVNWR